MGRDRVWALSGFQAPVFSICRSDMFASYVVLLVKDVLLVMDIRNTPRVSGQSSISLGETEAVN